MSPNERQSWEWLVCLFLGRTKFVEPVKNNGPHMAGVMWANGRRKSSTRGEWFGRYFSAARFSEIIQLNDWMATHFQELAPGVLERYHQVLLKNQLPSMDHHGLSHTLEPPVYLDLNNVLGVTMKDK
ncbi:hypothetical protein VP01_3566g2 [Puccinia sorghi]|uniref:Tet-like 2OG-Fe(II) oxygenase domain-containing protein n=1 Tax=Puccinia sorghi TaxID=27349 RepID=A0A0L6UW60_9BASI|nr:hypothetical protein VP01_3566g2 [Puccinia sorghi]